MNIADILRKVADALAAAEQQNAPEAEPEIALQPEPAVAVSDCGCGAAPDEEPEMSPQDKPASPEGDEAAWMPPQTQEMELMKKMAGEPNEFDGGENTDGEMDRLKQLAGITAIKR